MQYPPDSSSWLIRFWLPTLLVVVVACCATGCSDDASKVADSRATTDSGDLGRSDAGATADASDIETDVVDPVEIPITASEAYLARRAEYLEFCSDGNAPDGGNSEG